MLEQISKIGIVPVIKIEDAEKAVPLAKALIAGGLPVAEVTFRTSKAPEAIARIAKECPEMLVGAGTVLSVEQAKQAVDCGAKFLVSPGFNPRVVSWCLENDIFIVPGISTPSEIELALEMGLKTVKFFPAEQSGGIAKIKAMAAPYGGVSFMPTGGIGLDNLNDYLSFKKVVACGGSFMVKEEWINDGNWAEITRVSRLAVDQMLNLHLAHIGINPAESEADGIAEAFCALLSKPAVKSAASTFVGDLIEVMHAPYLGKNGHIAIGTNSLDRAVYHLQQRGFAFNPETVKKNEKGEAVAIYLKDEIGGFAVHLVQK